MSLEMPLVYGAVGALLVGVGFHALVGRADPLRKIIALNVMGSGTFLFLVASAQRHPEGPDPVPHALALTGIVVTLAATAVAIALVRSLERLQGASREGDAGP